MMQIQESRIVPFMQLIVAVVLCNAAGFIGSVWTQTGPGSWYADILVKPWFTPPGFVFPIVWTTLYILMGVSAFLIWQAGINKREVKIALGLFGLQLLLNILWSYFFFGLQSPLYGLAEILLLLCAVVATILAFWRIRPLAAYLLLPYLLWGLFATLLTGWILLNN
jgi:tryptophan-rich sensory protein